MEKENSNEGKGNLEIPKDLINRISKKIKILQQKNNLAFDEAITSLKYIFKAKNLVKPKNWEEIFYEWFYEKYPDILATTHWDDFYTLVGDRKIILEWAEEYTESILKQKIENNQNVEKGEAFAVRYELIELLFNEKEEFRLMDQTKREQIYKYILGISGTNGTRTARAIKNKDPKYRNQNHKKRAEVLLDKIKKGIIL